MNRSEVETLLKNNLKILSRQQVKTIKGQLNSGNIDGAYKGVSKIIKRAKGIVADGK